MSVKSPKKYRDESRVVAKGNADVVVVRAYDRPVQVLRLLQDIQREMPAALVGVFDDASPSDMSPVRARCEARGWNYVRAEENHGKRHAWRWFNQMFASICGHVGNALVFFLDDDMRLCRGFLGHVRSAWASVVRPPAATLQLMVDDSRRDATCWTGFSPEDAGPRTEKEEKDIHSPGIPETS